MTKQEAGKISKKILDFYSDTRLAKEGERPYVEGGRFIREMQNDTLLYNDLNLDFLKACMLIYLYQIEEEDWFEGRPLHQFPRLIGRCKEELKYKKKFYKGTEEEFYKKYVEDTINKWGIKNVGQNGGNQPENTES